MQTPHTKLHVTIAHPAMPARMAQASQAECTVAECEHLCSLGVCSCHSLPHSPQLQAPRASQASTTGLHHGHPIAIVTARASHAPETSLLSPVQTLNASCSTSRWDPAPAAVDWAGAGRSTPPGRRQARCEPVSLSRSTGHHEATAPLDIRLFALFGWSGGCLPGSRSRLR